MLASHRNPTSICNARFIPKFGQGIDTKEIFYVLAIFDKAGSKDRRSDGLGPQEGLFQAFGKFHYIRTIPTFVETTASSDSPKPQYLVSHHGFHAEPTPPQNLVRFQQQFTFESFKT